MSLDFRGACQFFDLPPGATSAALEGAAATHAEARYPAGACCEFPGVAWQEAGMLVRRLTEAEVFAADRWDDEETDRLIACERVMRLYCEADHDAGTAVALAIRLRCDPRPLAELVLEVIGDLAHGTYRRGRCSASDRVIARIRKIAQEITRGGA